MVVKTYLKNERGLALVVALMLLILLTVMGLAAISTTTTELQITSNELTDARAFHAAEAGIKEALYRSTLQDSGINQILIANNGSWATVNGNTFNAAINDPQVLAGGNPDPNWQYNVYFGAPPAGTNNVRSILSTSDQSKLNYATGTPVTIRYVKESDLRLWGIVDYDKNFDGDDMDLVYYNGDTITPARVRAGTALNGTADTAPPVGGNRNLVVRLVTSTGRSGKATKKIQLEMAGYPANPTTSSALQIDAPIQLTGNGFISGYNHSENTQKTDSGSYNQNLYNANGCDNYSGGAGTGGCGMALPDPDANLNAPYSGKVLATGSKPAVLANLETDIDTSGSFEGWGGTDDPPPPAGWKKVDAAAAFPDLKTLLGVDQTVVDNIKANANTSAGACPSGVTYIDNKLSTQVYKPSSNCPSGEGILIVTGDMKVTAQFEFRGLIYVEGDLDMAGGSWFLGAAAVKGRTVAGNKLGTGGATILYSNNTVVNAVTAAMMQVGSAFTTLSWREY
ncbi:MAG: PilX N-terminal domain-containing pilus assembly protein [Nitrospirota bacterium]